MPAVKASPPARVKKEAPRLPDPAAHLTAVIPGRAKRRPTPSPELTDPYLAIFDILDAERGQATEKRSQTRKERALSR